MTKDILKKKIEAQRSKLIELATHYSYSSPKVIEASMLLDQMLNQLDKEKK